MAYPSPDKQNQGGSPMTRSLAHSVFAVALVVAGGVASAQDKIPPLEIPSDHAFESHYIEVHGHTLHYLDTGEGSDTFVFLHGQPTSSYMWRNVIPHVSDLGRAVAPDNIGFGGSDQPADLDYRYPTHYRYIEGFIDALELDNIIFVIHDWGSALGLDYAARHPDRVRGVVMMEAIVPPTMPAESYDAMRPQLGEFFRTMRNPEIGPKMMIEDNYFVEGVLPGFTVRPLGEAEMTVYRAPFLDMAKRVAINQWPNEIPIGGEPADVVEVVDNYVAWMYSTDTPMLFLYAHPGALNPPADVDWLAARVSNMETSYIGRGLHYVAEDQPYAIGRAIRDWHRRNLN